MVHPAKHFTDKTTINPTIENIFQRNRNIEEGSPFNECTFAAIEGWTVEKENANTQFFTKTTFEFTIDQAKWIKKTKMNKNAMLIIKVLVTIDK